MNDYFSSGSGSDSDDYQSEVKEGSPESDEMTTELTKRSIDDEVTLVKRSTKNERSQARKINLIVMRVDVNEMLGQGIMFK